MLPQKALKPKPVPQKTAVRQTSDFNMSTGGINKPTGKAAHGIKKQIPLRAGKVLACD